MIALPLEKVRIMLQTLFRAGTILKVGYGLGGDLAAIARRLGSDGGACVAIVSPAIDVGVVHRLLYRRRVPGIMKVLSRSTEPSLSARTSAV